MRVLWPLWAACLLGGPSVAWSAWGPGGCAPAIPVGIPAAYPVAYAEHYEWRPAQQGREMHLYKNGGHVGGWNVAGGYYQRWLGDRWEASVSKPPVSPPVAAPRPVIGADEPPRNEGLIPERIGGEESHWVGGRRLSQREYERLHQGPDIPDTTGLLELVVISADAERRRKVLDDFRASAPTAVRDRYELHELIPGRWQAEPYQLERWSAFKQDGLAILAQTKRGEVLHAQSGYDGPGNLAFAAAEALRKADPRFDPAGIPDLRPRPQPPAPPVPEPPSPAPWQPPPWLAWLALPILGLLTWLFPRRK